MPAKLTFILVAFVFFLETSVTLFPDNEQPPVIYSCLPCGSSCDNDTYTQPGTCSHCGMELVDASTITFKHLQPSELCAYITAHPNAVLLDVRSSEEFEGTAEPDFGRLKNAVNIPIGELDARMDELSSLKNREIIVFCSHSHRSPQVSYKLSRNGFTNITNLDGGMSVMTDNSCMLQ